MSLPSRAKFYKDGKLVVDICCNIGWVYDEKYMKRCVEDSIKNYLKYDPDSAMFDWDTVSLYGKNFSKNDLDELAKR